MKPDSLPPGVLAEHGVDPYDNYPRMRKIAIVVAILHVLVLGIPLASGCFMLEKEKQVPVIKATMVAEIPPLGDSLDVPPDAAPPADVPAPQAPEPVEMPVMPDLPDIKTSSDPVPDLPEPPPVPDPPLPSKNPPPPDVKPPKEKPKEKPKEQPKEKPKEQPKEKPKKTRQKMLTADEIRKAREKNMKKSVKDDRAEKAKAQAEARAKAQADARAQAEAARKARLNAITQMQGEASKKRYGSALGDPNSLSVVGESNGYIDAIAALLQQRWREPNDTELNGKRPSVLLTLEIGADGTLKRKDFKRCGVAAMDRSVEETLQGLNVVPKPPRAMTITVTLRVRE